ncbi:MAG: hypothetical protein IJ546_00890 [Prevotella sp.]|nr:hypothetical protein [Prevotella sp.]
MKNLTITMLVLLSALLTACHDDADPTPVPTKDGAWVVTVVSGFAADTPTMLPRQATYESITVSIKGRTADTRTVIVTTDADWLTVMSDSLPADSIIALAAATNATGHRREATLTFTDADNAALSATLTLTQRSASDSDDNGDEAREQLYVGYGYDIYKALESTMAVRTRAAVLDGPLLWQENQMGGDLLIQDCRLGRTATRYVSANDIHAFGRNLAEQQTGDANNHFEGCRQECLTASSTLLDGHGTLEQQNFGHGSIEKAVASRVIDRGALMAMKRRSQLPFTTAFALSLRAVRSATGDTRTKTVEQTLTDFGTHVIIQVDLGGRIDYTFTMQKTTSFNSMEEMRQEIDYTLGRIADSDRTAKLQTTSSSKSRQGAITVRGGSTATRQRLEADINGLSTTGQVSPSHITDWLATINYTQYPERDDNLEVIHFELMPLWDLVPDDLRQDFMDATFRMAQRSDSSLPASFTGTDIYEIDATQPDLFGFSSPASLCRLLYMNGEPVMEVCSEYVPKIRTDERVVIAYPIYKQHIRMNQGLFLGDSIHQPAYVGFSGSDCYVNPIMDYEPGQRITRFWYVNGNLLLNSPTNVSGLTGKSRTVEDDTFQYIFSTTHRHPIVKVGSKFWTRRDIDHSMGFTDNPNNRRARTNEHLVDGVLYGRYYYDIGYYQQKDNETWWGYQPNTYYDGGPNTKWYVPLPDDVRQLYAYLGFNPKALYRGEVSGYDAAFNGYYGIHDFLTGGSFGDGQMAVRYRGRLNIFATRASGTDAADNASQALLLMLDPDYRFTLQEAVGEWHSDYFPIRPVRGWMYEYPTLN